MRVSVTFRHLEADQGVKDYIKEKVQKLQKYLVTPREVHVVLSVEKFRHFAELTIIGDGVTYNSEGKDRDLYTAIDQMVEKMDRQVREGREKAKRKRENALPFLAPLQKKRKAAGGKEGSENPPLIHRRRFPVQALSLEEAVSELELSKEDFLFFINSDSGQINGLCQKDGGYEWVEPYPK